MTTNGQAGKREWIRSVVDRYEGPLVRYAQRLTHDGDRARDVVQEAFLRLWREEPRRLDGHLAVWLFTVCRNQAIDVRRKESRMTQLADAQLDASPGGDTEPSIAAERQDTLGRVLQLLDRLPDNQQEVIRLKFQDGLSYKEISAVTGHSVSNVGFLIHRGIKTLRERLHRVET